MAWRDHISIDSTWYILQTEGERITKENEYITGYCEAERNKESEAASSKTAPTPLPADDLVASVFPLDARVKFTKSLVDLRSHDRKARFNSETDEQWDTFFDFPDTASVSTLPFIPEKRADFLLDDPAASVHLPTEREVTPGPILDPSTVDAHLAFLKTIIPGASDIAIQAAWEDLYHPLAHEYNRPLDNPRWAVSYKPGQYPCPIVVNGIQCTATFANLPGRLNHMEGHFKGRFLCPGVCRHRWFLSLANLDTHLKNSKQCKPFRRHEATYQIRKVPRWLSSPHCVVCLPEDDPLHATIEEIVTELGLQQVFV